VGQPGCGRRLPQPGQLTIGEELLGYHNNNLTWQPKVAILKSTNFQLEASAAGAALARYSQNCWVPDTRRDLQLGVHIPVVLQYADNVHIRWCL